jgi:predicted anti-sigma-YlaC factor YlaD
MTPLLTCKEFLAELSDYLDEKTRSEVKDDIEAHLTKCPNCWVVCDTTRKTIQVFKGLKSCDIPPDVHSRLMAAVDRKIAAKKSAN